VQVVLRSDVELLDVETAISDVVTEEPARMPAFSAELLRGDYSVC
jgi:hypothetical protein